MKALPAPPRYDQKPHNPYGDQKGVKDTEATLTPQEFNEPYDIITIDGPIAVTRESTKEQVIDSDLAMNQTMLEVMHFALGKCRSVSSICRVAAEATKLIEARRHILGVEYGYSGGKDTRKSPFDIIA